jgi:peptidoglycan-N-acetylglucosamine deacetylase
VNRRQLLIFTAAMPLLARAFSTNAQKPEIAFTFDDPKTDDSGNLQWPQVNECLLHTLGKHNLKAMLFVSGKRVDSEQGHMLLSEWNTAEHGLANHTYSHRFFNASEGRNKITLAEFEDDTLKNEPLITGYSHFARLFRFPFFKEGDTIQKRDGMRAFLKEHGYRSGRATIDASDWAISARMEARMKADPKVNLTPYRDFYLQHIWERAQFYDSLANRALGHPVSHTVLLHHNALNAMFLGDLIAMFKQRGWNAINAERAYADPVYDRQPNTLPAGESLIWALAKETGKFEKELRYPGEDDTYENPNMDALKL